MLHPRMIDLQLEYVRKVSEALALKEDPALAMVEINNETSLVYHWQTGALDTLVTGEYRTELARQWNGWLANRYSSTDDLRAAWGGAQEDGPDLLPGNWRIENHNSNTVTLNAAADAITIDAPASPRPIIVKQVGFTTTTERPYMAEIELPARAAALRRRRPRPGAGAGSIHPAAPAVRPASGGPRR
jgi:hypothetical protein